MQVLGERQSPCIRAPPLLPPAPPSPGCQSRHPSSCCSLARDHWVQAL
jgi:hypothetical protein